ncbi:uncharacterized protein EAE97_008429 [Botrytis byssoidea]|uniref:Uncharacterized protein n=1 Tax=Botrytis byssoidea TaxID=139641 RepID=A0A9P5LPP8_9HELO|nr:uncharacterized protein EAE97_008429 [Botrytis byssoidea]KAF7934069.1 hypothetical protein EAE97_008429 [Botrytis byssoidea]
MTRNPVGQRNPNRAPRAPKEQRAIVQIDDCFEDYMFPDGQSSTSFHGANDRHPARATFADRGSDTTSKASSVESETQISGEEDQYTDQESADSDTWSTETLQSDDEPAPKNQHEDQYQSGSPPPTPPPPSFVCLNNASHRHEHHETHRQLHDSNSVPVTKPEEQTFLSVAYEAPSSHRVPRIPERFACRPPPYFLSHYELYDYDSNWDELLCLRGDSEELDYPWAIICPPERPIEDCDDAWERRRSLAIFRTRTRSLDRYMRMENAK